MSKRRGRCNEPRRAADGAKIIFHVNQGWNLSSHDNLKETDPNSEVRRGDDPPEPTDKLDSRRRGNMKFHPLRNHRVHSTTGLEEFQQHQSCWMVCPGPHPRPVPLEPSNVVVERFLPFSQTPEILCVILPLLLCGLPYFKMENGKAKKRRPKSLYEPTENMLASRRELEQRKQQIKPEDDPFWEKRGGKGERLYPKYPDVTVEKRQQRDHHGNIIPLPSSSKLLTPTKAFIRGSYHKEQDHTSKQISPLPVSSHLLTPTKASSLGEYHTATSLTPPKSAVSNSPVTQGHSATLLELTANRRASMWEKKPEPEVDPREEGWKNILLDRRNTGFREVTPVPVAHHSELYKDVKSRLYSPTIASSHQMWIHFHHGEEGSTRDDLMLDEDGIEISTSNLWLDEGSDHHSEEHVYREGEYQPYESYAQARYANICSRLHEPTTATKAAMWANRMPSPPPRRRSSDQISGAPQVEGKTTTAQQYNRREKFTRFDSKDLGKERATGAAGERRAAGSKGKMPRSESAPVFGRVYVPVYTPIASRAQLVQRFPRSISPSPRQQYATRACSPPASNDGPSDDVGDATRTNGESGVDPEEELEVGSSY
jgi:hypothetical protein